MTKNNLLLININVLLILSSFLLHSCSDTKVMGRRDDVFEVTQDLKDQNMTTAFVGDAVIVSDWRIDGNNTNKSCVNVYIDSVYSYNLSKKWSQYIGIFNTLSDNISSPIVFGNKVFYLSPESHMIVIELNTGKQIFDKQLVSNIPVRDKVSPHGGIGIDENGILFISLNDGRVISLSFSESDNDYKIIWEQNIGSTGSPPIIYKNIIFVNTGKNSLYALDKKDGKIQWVLNTITEMTTMPKIASASVFDDKVFITMQNLESYVLNSNTGEVIGVDSLIGKSYFSSPMSFVSSITSPVIDDNIMLAANTDNLISAISYNGSISRLWSLPFGTYATPCMNNGIAFIATSTNKLLAINTKNGKIIWEFNLSKLYDYDFYVMGIVMVNNNLVMNTNKGDIIFINSITGEFIAHQHISDGFISPLIVVQDNIIAIDIDGYIVDYGFEKGKAL